MSTIIGPTNELDKLNNMFLELDRDKTGTVSKVNIEAGLAEIYNDDTLSNYYKDLLD